MKYKLILFISFINLLFELQTLAIDVIFDVYFLVFIPLLHTPRA